MGATLYYCTYTRRLEEIVGYGSVHVERYTLRIIYGDSVPWMGLGSCFFGRGRAGYGGCGRRAMRVVFKELERVKLPKQLSHLSEDVRREQYRTFEALVKNHAYTLLSKTHIPRFSSSARAHYYVLRGLAGLHADMIKTATRFSSDAPAVYWGMILYASLATQRVVDPQWINNFVMALPRDLRHNPVTIMHYYPFLLSGMLQSRGSTSDMADPMFQAYLSYRRRSTHDTQATRSSILGLFRVYAATSGHERMLQGLDIPVSQREEEPSDMGAAHSLRTVPSRSSTQGSYDLLLDNENTFPQTWTLDASSTIEHPPEIELLHAKEFARYPARAYRFDFSQYVHVLRDRSADEVVPFRVCPGREYGIIKISAPWCGPCRRSFPHYSSWLAEYHDRFFGGVIMRRKDLVREKHLDLLERYFLNRNPSGVPFGTTPKDATDAAGWAFIKSVGMYAFPTYLLVDREGYVLAAEVGGFQRIADILLKES